MSQPCKQNWTSQLNLKATTSQKSQHFHLPPLSSSIHKLQNHRTFIIQVEPSPDSFHFPPPVHSRLAALHPPLSPIAVVPLYLRVIEGWKIDGPSVGELKFVSARDSCVRH